MLALGRLLRLSLGPSAPADVAAGILFASAVWPGGAAPWFLLAAALCIYHGGMALNDWADRGRDAVTCPGRPIPAGEVAPATALALAGILLGSGALLAGAATPLAGGIAVVVAGAAVTYDLVGRGPWRGPLLLGLCRAGNLGVGLGSGWLLGAGGRPAPETTPVLVLLLPALLYGAYVFVVSRLGRLEDGEDARPLAQRPRGLLLTAMLLLLLVPLLPRIGLSTGPPDVDPLLGMAERRGLSALVVAGGAVFLLRRALRREPWTPGAVRQAMGTALRALFVFTSALALLGGTTAAVVAAVLILAGLPLGVALRRVFPPS